MKKELQETYRKANELILQAEEARLMGLDNLSMETYYRAGKLEEKLYRTLKKEGDKNAVVYLMSAATCYLHAGEDEKARKLLLEIIDRWHQTPYVQDAIELLSKLTTRRDKKKKKGIKVLHFRTNVKNPLREWRKIIAGIEKKFFSSPSNAILIPLKLLRRYT